MRQSVAGEKVATLKLITLVLQKYLTRRMQRHVLRLLLISAGADKSRYSEALDNPRRVASVTASSAPRNEGRSKRTHLPKATSIRSSSFFNGTERTMNKRLALTTVSLFAAATLSSSVQAQAPTQPPKQLDPFAESSVLQGMNTSSKIVQPLPTITDVIK